MGVRGRGCSCGLGLEEPQGGPVRLMGMAPLCITGLQPQGMVLLGHACLRVPMGCKDVGERLVQQVDGQVESGPIRAAPRDLLRAGGEEAGRGAGDGCPHPSGYLEA